jgi:hypothetical protein
MIDSLSPVGVVAVGAVVGLLGTLVMDVPMRLLLSEGMKPPFVAAGAVTGTDTADAPRGVAMGIHYGAGVGAGVIFTTLVAAVGAVLAVGPTVGGIAVSALAVAAVVQLPVMIAFFSYFVLPTYATVARQRLGPIRRSWALSALVYVAAVSVLLPLASGVVA